MKSILTQAILEGVRSKKDRSLSLTFSTPELTVTERSVFMELQGIVLELTVKPIDELSAPEMKVDKDMEQKSQSRRIRDVLFVLFSQDAEGFTDFELYYKAKTEKYISFLKEKINESY